MQLVNGKNIESCKYELKVFDRLGHGNCQWAIKEIESLREALEEIVKLNRYDGDEMWIIANKALNGKEVF